MKASLDVSLYTPLEETQVKSDMRMCFAVNAEVSLITTGLANPDRLLRSGVANLRETMASLPGLRCRPGFACFNIYPTCENAMEINKLLWRTVNSGYFDPSIGNKLFGNNVFVLGVAAELYDFLVHVSLETLEGAIIDFLVLLHHQLTTDGDVVGVEKLRDELVPCIWEQVEKSIGIFENGEPKDAERASTLEHLVQISFMTPWRVDVLAGYLSPQDMATLILSGPLPAAARLPAVGPDSVGARGSALLKMYEDWLVYDDILCQRLSMERNAALEAMDRALYSGRSKTMFSEARTVIDLCQEDTGIFSLLPEELVERALVPWIVRRNCESIPPRKRRLATLKSLLELSSKFFDELELADMDLGGDLPYEGSYEAGLDADMSLQELHIDTSHQDRRSVEIASYINPICENIAVSDISSAEYPLDAKPPCYSRIERHGGVIDLAIIPGGIDRFDMQGDIAEFIGGEFANAMLQPESGPSSQHFGQDL
jgi:hypothetical protein